MSNHEPLLDDLIRAIAYADEHKLTDVSKILGRSISRIAPMLQKAPPRQEEPAQNVIPFRRPCRTGCRHDDHRLGYSEPSTLERGMV